MNKKEILELKRRMTKTNCTFTRMCGCYVNAEKEIVLTFNENFLNLGEDELHKYLEMDTYPFNPRGKWIPSPALASSRNSSHPHPFFLVQNRTYPRLPRGSRLLDTMKSSRSMIFVPAPNGSNPANTLKPSTQGILNTTSITTFASTLLRLDHPSRSIANEIIFSNTATIVVNAAKVRNRKNNAAHALPPGII